MRRRPAIAIALAGAALLALSACSGGSASSESSAAADSSAAEAPAAETPAAEPPAAPTPAPAPTSAPAKPSAANMETDRLADAVLEQLKLDWPDTLADQLITISLSPLMRQLASTADVTTRVASKGPKVTLTLTGDDATCVVTVTDAPRARGVVCKQA